MILQVKKNTITRGEAASTHHQALHVCALWHKVTKAHPLVRVIVMMICLLTIQLCKKNLKYAKVCTSQQKKLKNLKEKLYSSQEAYQTLLEQYENFANLNVEQSTKIEQLKASASLSIFKIFLHKFIKRRHFIITITLTRG